MEGMTNQTAYQFLGAVVNGMSGAQLPVAAEEKDTGKFQELMDKAKSGESSSPVEEQPKAQKPAVTKTKKEVPAQKQEEDPVETIKRMQAFLVPVSPEELSQYPVEWLPQVEEGEPIICIGVTVDENGQRMPILVGAEDVTSRYGKPVHMPKPIDVPKPKMKMEVEAKAETKVDMDVEVETEAKVEVEVEVETRVEVEAETDATPETAIEVEANNSPAAVPEKVATEQFVGEVQQAVEKVKPQVQQEETDEITVEYGEAKPEPVFHDVKAAPIKVSNTAEVRETEEAPDVDRQLDNRLTQALLQGETRVELQLTPEHLGTVKVEITRTAEGTLHVSLSTQNGQTRSLLEKHVSDLQNSLGTRTQDQVKVEVNKQEESQRRDQNPYEGHNGQEQRQQQEHRRQRQAHSGEDFLQQLRLGLIPVEE